MNRKPHRQICSLCWEVCRVDFFVPHETWKLAMHQHHWNERVCLNCFTRLADERQVEWCKDIKFFPESMIHMIKRNEAELVFTGFHEKPYLNLDA